LVLILLGVVSLVSFFAQDYSINEQIQEVLTGLFGWSAFLVSILLILVGVLFIDSLKLKIKEFRVTLGVFSLLLVLAGLLHIFFPEDVAYKVAKAGRGGGLVGYKISSLLRETISVWGGVPVLILLLVITTIFIFNLSLDQVLTIVSKYFPDLKLDKFKFAKSKDSENNNEFEMEGSLADTQSSKEKEEVFSEPSIEIVPTMSEPQGDVSNKMLDGQPVLASIPNPLGMDRVWQPPPLDLLMDPSNEEVDSGDIKARAKIIKEKLRSFGIIVDVVDIQKGPSVTQYALKAGSDVRIAKIASLQTDLALALASPNGTVRIEAPIPGKSLVGIEVPNNKRAIVSIKPLLNSSVMKEMKSKLAIILGKDVGGRVVAYDISKMPHILVAGATGSGKSVFLHNILFSILFRASPQEVKFILIDPKRVELTYYQDIPHLLTPVVTDMDKARSVFKWAVSEMERRYKLFEQAKAMNIYDYNEKSGFQSLSNIIIMVDEFAEIMVQDPTGMEKSVVRLAQLARATGIHLVLALQRPTTDVITGLIKANIPTRVAFNVASNMDSRVIIDQPGAEKLLSKGDMLFVPPDRPKPQRLQGAFVSPTEIKNLVDYLKNSGISPEYRKEVLSMGEDTSRGFGSGVGANNTDQLFDKAADLVISAGRGSASLIQTRLSVGYARAARILSQLEARGIVGPPEGSKPRKVLVSSYGDDVVEEEPLQDEVPMGQPHVQ